MAGSTSLSSAGAPTEGSARAPVRVGFVLHLMHVAGAEMLVAETIRRLGSRLDPVIFCLDGVGPLGERMRGEGVPVIDLQRQPGLDLSVSGRLAREIRDRRIDVVHAHQYTPFFYTALARLRTRHRCHVMFTEHGRHFPDIVSAKRRLLNTLVLSRLADEINGVCEFSIRSLAEKDGFPFDAMEVIENGIDPELYDDPRDRRDVRAALGLDPHRRIITCIARFHPVKDHAALLTAFADVARVQPDVDLVLAGDGPLRGALEGQAATLGIADRVKFLGVRRDVPQILQAADVFALTSVSEAASLTLLEAMAAARPVVVTAVGGNPEIVRPGVDGLLVPRGDAPAIAAAFLELLADDDKARAMGAAGRARVREKYRLNDTVERYYDRYRRAADALRPPARRVERQTSAERSHGA